ncbi:MAG: hypothetical protein ABR608_08550 [Pseudonocardiaceae bacterium]
MSPVSRGRKGRKKSTRRPARPAVLGARDECDCPACSGAQLDPRELIDELLAAAGELISTEDPLDVEMAGAAFMSVGARTGEVFQDALVGGFIPEFEARASAEALVMLLAIGSVTTGPAARAAAAAAARLVQAGIPRPGWAAELSEPVTLGQGWRLIDSQGTASMLAAVFHRAGRAHTVIISVDHLDCGAAEEILLFPADHLAQALQMIQADGREDGLVITTEALDPAELRWQIETALDARAVHDRDEGEWGIDDAPDDEDSLPGYRTLATLMRARMHTLPTPSKPPAPHGAGEDHHGELTAVQMLARLTGNRG